MDAPAAAAPTPAAGGADALSAVDVARLVAASFAGAVLLLAWTNP